MTTPGNSGSATASTVIVLPALSIRGGQWEALRLARDIQAAGHAVTLLVMWKHRNELDVGELPKSYLSDWEPKRATAPLQIPVLLWRMRRWLNENARRSSHRPTLVTTHFSTLPALWLVSTHRRATFVQDLEWRFMSARVAAELLRRAILAAYRGTQLVMVANSYLSRALAEEGIRDTRLVPIWADRFFATQDDGSGRPFDIVVMLRHGEYKRPDLYFELLRRVRSEFGLRCIAITPDDDHAERARGMAEQVLLRPSRSEIRSAYLRAKVFVHLSEHEGFGLPPLEAMGAGCIPVCRDSGGVTCYMHDARVRSNLLPLSATLDEIIERIRAVLADADARARMSDEARAAFADGEGQTLMQRRHFFADYDD
ncbi:MAG: glycosyltransferase family 4 protein [Pseudomonadota bacterium]|nr:glycosyltransferase family 4 protein [Pseudomonadota bacterium]